MVKKGGVLERSDHVPLPGDVAARIRALRRGIKLSRPQFAELLDISVTLLRQWEQGQAQPSL